MPISPIEDMKQFKSDTAYKLFFFAPSNYKTSE